MSRTHESLLNQVKECRRCAGKGWFRSSTSGEDYRFPPTIGCRTNTKILFIGLNPRASASNLPFHEAISRSAESFRALSNNRTPDGSRYITQSGPERHYNLHMRIVDRVFPGREFEQVAAVTELHLCASESGKHLPSEGPCNAIFLPRVVEMCNPEVIIALGAKVRDWFRPRVALRIDESQLMATVGPKHVRVLVLPHPNSRGPKEEAWRAGISVLQWHFSTQVKSHRTKHSSSRPQRAGGRRVESSPPAQPYRSAEPQEDSTNQTDSNPTILRECNWHERQGWKPNQRPADLKRLEREGGFIRFVLIRDGVPRYWMEMTADQWKTALGSYYHGKWATNGYATRLTSTQDGAPTERFITRWRPHVTGLG